MANPNIVGVATIAGASIGQHLGTNNVALVTVTSEYILKINSIIVANIDGTNAATCTIKVVKVNHTILGVTDKDWSGDYFLAKTVNVPPGDILVVLDSPIYLMEGDNIGGLASVAGDLDCIISFEVIVD